MVTGEHGAGAAGRFLGLMGTPPSCAGSWVRTQAPLSSLAPLEVALSSQCASLLSRSQFNLLRLNLT